MIRIPPAAAIGIALAAVTLPTHASEHLGVTADDFRFESSIDGPGDNAGDLSREPSEEVAPSRDAVSENASGDVAAAARADNAGERPQAPSDAASAGTQEVSPVEVRNPEVKRAGDRPPPVDPHDGARAGEPDTEDGGEVDDASVAGKSDFAYESVYDGYRAYDEADGPGWIESNRRVGEVGGWRTYAREIYEAQKAESAAAEDGN